MKFCAKSEPKRNKIIAGIIIFNEKTDKLLVLIKKTGKADLPKGHVEAGETFLEAAIRECYEETGLHPSNSLNIYPTVISMPSKSWIRFYLGRTYHDQIQLSDEHLSYKWVSIDQIDKYFGDQSEFSRLLEAMYVLSHC